MAKTTSLELFVINRVIFYRLVYGLSKRQLSLNLKHNESYVAKVESESEENSYPPHEWPKLAFEFSCTIHDLLPPNDMDQNSTGKLVDKVILSVSNESDLKLVIEGLIVFGFFDLPKTIEDISKHLFIEKKEQVDLLFKVLSGIVKEGSLKQRLLDYYRKIV